MDQVEKELYEQISGKPVEDSAVEGNIRSRTLNSINKRLVCFISAYRQKDKNGNPIPVEVNEQKTQKLADALRNDYGFGYRTHLGYYREENESAPEYEKSLAVNGYELDGSENDDKLIEKFKNIMLTLAREYEQYTIIISVPNKGADLIDVKTANTLLHFTNLTEEQLSAEFMEQRKKDLSSSLAYTSLGYRRDQKGKKDANFNKGDKGRRVQWVSESIEEVESYRRSISHGMLISAKRKKANEESIKFYNPVSVSEEPAIKWIKENIEIVDNPVDGSTYITPEGKDE